jgi:membrane protein DedA with SNARE-associated domain/membrane-associated phospholipid phosphatase
VSALFDTIGSLAGPAAYLVVAVLAALEASAFVGLFVPGELAMLVGGYITYQDKASLAPMIAAAIVGAIVGDSVGYEIGRHLGPSIRRSRLGRRVGEERWLRAEQYLAVKGGRAVFFGRFIGVLRALVPALAGASRMPYRKFLFWNALGAIIWASALVTAGFAAGSSYRRVEHYAGRAGLVLLVLFVMIGGVAMAGHWVSKNPDIVRDIGRRIMARPLPSRIDRRFHGQIEFLVNRLKPGQALGLALTLQLLFLGIGGWAFGALVRDVIRGGGASRIDGPISRSLINSRDEWLTTVMQAVTELGGTAVVAMALAVVALVTWMLTRNWVTVVVLGSALVGAWVLGDVVKPLIGRARPTVSQVTSVDGYAFPSAHATRAIAVYGALAYVAAGWFRAWSAKVAVWTIALALVLLVGFSRIYLGLHWTTDVLGGYALGATWLASVLVTTSAIQGVWRRRRALGTLPASREMDAAGQREIA